MKHHTYYFRSQQIEVAGDLCVDPGQRTVQIDSKLIELTRTEFDILHFLCMHKGWVVTRQQIADSAFEPDKYVEPHSITVMIYKIRKKIKSSATTSIKTMIGYGYKLEVTQKTK